MYTIFTHASLPMFTHVYPFAWQIVVKLQGNN